MQQKRILCVHNDLLIKLRFSDKKFYNRIFNLKGVYINNP